MKKVYFFFLLIFSVSGAIGQATNDYRSSGATTVRLDVATNWERWDGGSWVTAVSAPIGVVANGNTVTILSTATYAGSNTAVIVPVGVTILLQGLTLNPMSAGIVTFNGTFIMNTTSSFARVIGASVFSETSFCEFRGSSVLTPASSFSGRTFGNLLFTSTSGTYSITATGSSSLKINGSLSVGTGVTFNCNMTANPGHSIKGDISVASGAALNFNPASSGTISLNGTSSSQTITNSGTLSFGANQALVISNTAAIPSVTFNQSQTISGSITVNAGSILATNGTLTLSGTPTINGSFQINQSGWATGGIWSYGVDGTLIFNNSSGSYAVNEDVWWPLVNGPTNVTIQNAGGITMNVGRNVNGLFQTAAGVINANNLSFNGIAKINAGGYFSGRPFYGASSTLLYYTGGVYGRGDEWNCSAGLGCPQNLQIDNSTILNVPNGVVFTQGQIQGNLAIETGSAMYMDYGAVGQNSLVEVYKDVVINGSLSLGDAIGGDLHVKGNWIKNPGSTFTPNGRAVIFNASSGDQTITGDNIFDYLIISKPAGNLLLADNTTCNQVVTLSGGKIVLGNKNLIAGAVSGGSASSYIKTDGTGTLTIKNIGASDKFFLIGNATYNPVIIGNGSGHDWTVRVEDVLNNVPAPFNTNKAVLRTWTITPSVNPPTVGANMYFGYNDGDGSQLGSGFVNTEDVQLWHYNGSKWFAASSAITPGGAAGGQRTVAISNWSQFSSFAVANVTGPLPISILSFSGDKEGNRNQLRWTMVTEINNNGFEILRSTDGVIYDVIGFVKSSSTEGNTNTPTNYAFTDYLPSGSKQYYRLRQVGNNGNRTESNVLVIRSLNPVNLDIDVLYPNPANNYLNVAVSSPHKTVITLLIFDMTGRVLAKQVRSVNEGINPVLIDVKTLKKGSYMLKVLNEDLETVIRKFIKN